MRTLWLTGKVVIESKDLNYNYKFAINVKGVDVKSHGQVIIESKVPYWNYLFAKNVDGADVEAHMAIFINQSLTDANIKRLNKLLKQ